MKNIKKTYKKVENAYAMLIWALGFPVYGAESEKGQAIHGLRSALASLRTAIEEKDYVPSELLKGKVWTGKPNVNTMDIYRSSDGIATADILARGRGKNSRQAPCPPFCFRVEKLKNWKDCPLKNRLALKLFFEAYPTRKVAYVCDKVAVDKWLAAHPKSKMHALKNETAL